MDDMKDKFKGFVKKVSSSSSGKFKGQGRVLGTNSSSSSSSDSYNSVYARFSQPVNPKPTPNPSSQSNSIPSPQKSSAPVHGSSNPASSSAPIPKPSNGFDAFGPLITSSERSKNGYSLNVFECPICGQAYRSEEDVSAHVESCVTEGVRVADVTSSGSDDNNNAVSDGKIDEEVSLLDESCVAAYLSGKPPEGSLEVVLRLFRNIVRDPENVKFRRVRMGNPKIREAVTDVAGGVELLELAGFELKEEGGEMWALMEDVPGKERIGLINKVIGFLEPSKVENMKASIVPVEEDQPAERKKIDRQIKVFFAVSENVAAKIEVPDSFYNLSAIELKREADMRKKKLAESQLLVPKSFREKQAKALRRKYMRTVVRIQFPDGVVLQGVFAPWEPTTALYEFVGLALKDSSLEFDLMHPVIVKRRVIPRSAEAGGRSITLDDEDLVPSALIKFKPIETDSSVFTGLCNELLEISEPLT